MRPPENKKSHSDDMALPKLSDAATATGASAEVAGIFDDEPMCMQPTVWVSSHAAKKGSQAPLWMLGRPKCGGISLKQTARTPRAPLRRTSAAAFAGSHSGMRHSGMRAPLLSPHHSSTIQSLYAITQASASSWSLASRNVWPQKRGKVG